MSPLDGSTDREGGKPVTRYVTGSPSGSLAINCSLGELPAVLVCVPGFSRVGGVLVTVMET